MANVLCFIFSLYFFSTVTPVKSAKILLYPFFGGSNYLSMKSIAQELTLRNHQVTILVNSAQKIKNSDNIQHAVFQGPYESGFLEKHLVSAMINHGIKEMLFNNISMPKVQLTSCEYLFKDTALLDSFKDYDLLVADLLNFCTPLVSDYLGIRRVDYIAGPPRLLFLPSSYDALPILSYVPQMMTRNPSKMGFLQRVKNVCTCIVVKIAVRLFILSALQDLKVRMNIKPERSYLESFQEKELTLFMSDFAFEYPQPLRPDQKMVGPVNIQPVKPLPPDLLIDSSGDDGAIIVSFGTNIASILDKEKVDIMAEAFGRLRQKVIWRLKGYIPSPLSPNIKVVNWLPQNDLLAHEKLRAFVTHTGLNSVYEALYRGVPVVAVPIYGDQFDNANVMRERGVGLVADYKTMTADELYDKIQRVIYEPSFRENIQSISRLMNDRARSPVQEAGDWVEYTLRHESLAHLRPYSSQLTWYQFFLVDVAVFLVMVVVMVIMVIKYTVRLMCWMCCRRQNKQKTQ